MGGKERKRKKESKEGRSNTVFGGSGRENVCENGRRERWKRERGKVLFKNEEGNGGSWNKQ